MAGWGNQFDPRELSFDRRQTFQQQRVQQTTEPCIPSLSSAAIDQRHERMNKEQDQEYLDEATRERQRWDREQRKIQKAVDDERREAGLPPHKITVINPYKQLSRGPNGHVHWQFYQVK